MGAQHRQYAIAGRQRLQRPEQHSNHRHDQRPDAVPTSNGYLYVVHDGRQSNAVGSPIQFRLRPLNSVQIILNGTLTSNVKIENYDAAQRARSTPRSTAPSRCKDRTAQRCCPSLPQLTRTARSWRPTTAQWTSAINRRRQEFDHVDEQSVRLGRQRRRVANGVRRNRPQPCPVPATSKSTSVRTVRARSR